MAKTQLTEETLQLIINDYKQGMKLLDISKKHDIPKPTIQYHLKKLGILKKAGNTNPTSKTSNVNDMIKQISQKNKDNFKMLKQAYDRANDQQTRIQEMLAEQDKEIEEAFKSLAQLTDQDDKADNT